MVNRVLSASQTRRNKRASRCIHKFLPTAVWSIDTILRSAFIKSSRVISSRERPVWNCGSVSGWWCREKQQIKVSCNFYGQLSMITKVICRDLRQSLPSAPHAARPAVHLPCPGCQSAPVKTVKENGQNSRFSLSF